MDQPKWLRLSALGLLIIILGIGYFVITGKFMASKKSTSSFTNGSVSLVTPTPAPQFSPEPSKNAYSSLNNKNNQQNTKNLPKTGFAEDLVGILAMGLIITGLGLRKFPN